MARGGSPQRVHVHRVYSRNHRRRQHRHIVPFINKGAHRICLGRKVGAQDASFIAADYTKGKNLLANGDFEREEIQRGLPDNWTPQIVGTAQKHTYATADITSGASSISASDYTIFNPGAPILINGLAAPADGNGGIPINQGVIQNYRHKARERVYANSGWSGTGNPIVLSDTPQWPHPANQTVLSQAFVALDDRAGNLIQGAKAVRLASPDASTTVGE